MRTGPASLAHLRQAAPRIHEPLARRRDVGDAPGEAAEPVGFPGHAALQFVRDLDHQIAATEEQEARTPGRIGPVEPHVEAEPRAVERDRALGIGRADDDMVEPAGGVRRAMDRRRFRRVEQDRFDSVRRRRSKVARPHSGRRAMRLDRQGIFRARRKPAPFEQVRGLVEFVDAIGDRPQTFPRRREPGGYGLPKRPGAVGGDERESDVGRRVPDLARPARGEDAVRRAVEKVGIGPHRGVDVRRRQRNVMDGTDHGWRRPTCPWSCRPSRPW